MGDSRDTANSLIGLGFSEYEARTYSGLIGREPITGYALAKETGVPQPKVYETLGRLAARGAVVQIGAEPAKWVAIPPQRLLNQLETEFQRRLATAELELSRIGGTPSGEVIRPVWQTEGWDGVLRSARQLVGDARGRLYLSGHHDQLVDLQTEVAAADRRGVRIDVLCFGPIPFELSHGETIRHRSTEGIIYPHHQARHLAASCDGRAGLWALARTGEDWVGVWSHADDMLAALIKGYIRHDLFVQRMYSDFSEIMHQEYGPSLEGLTGQEPFRRAGDEDLAEPRLA